MNPPISPTPERLEQLQRLTQQYSKFSQTHGGLAFVLAAILIVLVRFLPAPSVMHGVVYTVIASLLWLFARPAITNRLYRTLGMVNEQHRKHSQVDFLFGLMVGFIAVWLLSTAVANLSNLVKPELFLPSARQLPLVGAVALSLIAIARKQLTDGIVILLLGAVATSVNNLSLFSDLQIAISHIMIVVFPIGLCLLGLKQHGDFKRLERELRGLSQPS
jgi:hypothetical protein